MTPARTPPLNKLVIGFPMKPEFVARLRASFPDLTIVVAPDQDSLAAEIVDADAVVAWDVDPALLATCRNLSWIQTVGAGVETVIAPAMIERGIILTNNSGVHAPNIAEHLMAMMLAFARGLPNLIEGQRRHEWRDRLGRERVFELNGQTLLIVGLGDIGLALARRAAPFGMRVVGVKRRPGEAPACVERVETLDRLDDELRGAGHVTICLPLTPRTRGLFDAARFAAMESSPYLYNIGRGAIVDHAALLDALRSGRVAGAGLDVTDPEPLPADSPLWDLPNVLITSHTSGATPRYWERGLVILEENIRRRLAGRDLLNVVDYAEGY